MKNKQKYYNSYFSCDGNSGDYVRLPRRFKKRMHQRKSATQIRKMIKELRITPPKNAVDSAAFTPNEFCPKCGCVHVRWSGNMGVYPERYEYGYCAHCSYVVWVSDNSRYYHCLEYPNFNYELP